MSTSFTLSMMPKVYCDDGGYTKTIYLLSWSSHQLRARWQRNQGCDPIDVIFPSHLPIVKYNLTNIINAVLDTKLCIFCIFTLNLKNLHTLFLRSWLCSLLVSVVAYGRLLLEDEGSLSLSLSFSLSPNQEKGMQVGMEVIESAGDRFPPDSSSNSADPLGIREK